MRTTVELSDEVRGKLLKLAARRGERGFSAIVDEAVACYLEEDEERRELARRARDVIGTMDDDEADALEEFVAGLRRRWR